MKQLGIIFTILVLSGCTGSIQDYQLDRLASLCGGYDEIKRVWYDRWQTPVRIVVFCKDGSEFDIND